MNNSNSHENVFSRKPDVNKKHRINDNNSRNWPYPPNCDKPAGKIQIKDMKKVLFIDRDGTILKEPADQQVDSLEKLEFMPGVIGALSAIARETDFEMVMVTNQDGLGTPAYPEEDFLPPQNKMLSTLAGEGVRFAEIFVDRTFESDNAPTRKPGTAMLTRYLATGVDLGGSFVIGDRLTDIDLAKNLGCRAIYVSDRQNEEASLCTRDWQAIRRFLTASREGHPFQGKQMRQIFPLISTSTVTGRAQSAPASASSTTCWSRLRDMAASTLPSKPPEICMSMSTTWLRIQPSYWGRLLTGPWAKGKG
jgi:histidinol-phosphatase